MYTGNEQVWPYLYQAQPAPRGHKVPVCGETCGAQQVIDRLLERAPQLGASFRCETAVTALVTDADRVVGVQWRQLGESGTARAATANSNGKTAVSGLATAFRLALLAPASIMLAGGLVVRGSGKATLDPQWGAMGTSLLSRGYRAARRCWS
jgi:hypothetical protein